MFIGEQTRLACLVFKKKVRGLFCCWECSTQVCCFFFFRVCFLFFFLLRAMRYLLARQAIMMIKEIVYNPNWLKSGLDIDLYTFPRLFPSASSSSCCCSLTTWKVNMSVTVREEKNSKVWISAITYTSPKNSTQIDRRRKSSPRQSTWCWLST